MLRWASICLDGKGEELRIPVRRSQYVLRAKLRKNPAVCPSAITARGGSLVTANAIWAVYDSPCRVRQHFRSIEERIPFGMPPHIPEAWNCNWRAKVIVAHGDLDPVSNPTAIEK
jgi:hypothetical protein